MTTEKTASIPAYAILGVLLFAWLCGLGYQLAYSALQIKQLERRLEVQDLSGREVKANIAIWPITFSVADNGFSSDEASVSAPAGVDKQAREMATPTPMTGTATPPAPPSPSTPPKSTR